MKNITDKQLKNKYDNPKRKSQEQKTERINLRVTKDVKDTFIFLQQKTFLSQSDLFSYLLNNNNINFIEHGRIIAKELAIANERLKLTNDLLQNNNNPEAISQLQQTNNSFEQVQTLLYKNWEGANNVNSKNRTA